MTIDKEFGWGLVVKDHEIGPYIIREFHPRKTSGVEVLREVDTTITHFHGYIDGKDAHESWDSLEGAMLGVIVRRMLGPNNSPLTCHFMAGLRGMRAEGRS